MSRRTFSNITLAVLVSSFSFLTLPGCTGHGGHAPSPRLPSAPTGIVTAITASDAVSISWDTVPEATSYKLYWKSSVSSWTIVSLSSNAYVHSGVSADETYTYAVASVNAIGTGPSSSYISLKIAAPGPPIAVSAVAGNEQVTLSWDIVQGAVSYNIYWTASPPASKASPDNSPGVASPTAITGLTNGSTYYFVVTAENAYNGSIESDQVMAVPDIYSGTVTVSGTIEYGDKEYDEGGFTGNTSFNPVRFADVEVVDTATGTIIGSGMTDASGAYSLTIPASGSEAYARVISSATLVSAPSAEVRNLSGTLFAVPGSSFIPSGDATVNIAVPVTNTAAGAFNILDVMTAGVEFVHSLSGSYPRTVKAYWNIGNSAGTYFCTSYDYLYCRQGRGIYIYGGYSDGSGDTDQFDDDVLWHEFGHVAADEYSRDESPGGNHSLSQIDEDLRLSWSEGWGDFVPGAIKYWLSSYNPDILSTTGGMASTHYVDTYNSSYLISFDFNTASTSYGTPPQPAFIYSSSEVAVAKVLWNLMEGTGNFGMQTVWDVFDYYMPVAASPVNFETFWDGWLAPPNSWTPAELTTMTNVLRNRQIFYEEDQYESDDGFTRSQAAITVGSPETHYLYKTDGSPDTDIIPFVATADTTYTVSTMTLKNGTDTFLRVIGPDQSTVIASNNNASGMSYYPVPNNCDFNSICHENTLSLLASTVFSFPASAGATYYFEVTTNQSYRPLSAGQYGTYSIVVTSP